MEKDLTVFQRDHMMSIIYGLMEEDEHVRASKETTEHKDRAEKKNSNPGKNDILGEYYPA